jgi:hypothetical protein
MLDDNKFVNLIRSTPSEAAALQWLKTIPVDWPSQKAVLLAEYKSTVDAS